MAIQTGQITVLKNNTVTNVEHQIRFIFAKENGERITRDTTAKGVINFDVPNGDWNVSWFAVDGDQKVLPLRAGLQLKITSSTPPTALADWIYGDNTHVADPILTQWATVLDEMKSVRDEFRKETQQDGTGKFVMQSSVKRNNLRDAGAYHTQTNPSNIDSWLAGDNGLLTNVTANIPSDVRGLFSDSFMYVETQGIYSSNLSNRWQTVVGYRKPEVVIRQYTPDDNGGWTSALLLSTYNTNVGNHGQLVRAGSESKDLLAVGDFGIGINTNTVDAPPFNPTSPVATEAFQPRGAIGMITAYHPVFQIAGGTNFGRLSIFNGGQASRGGKMIVQGGSATPTGPAWESEVMLKNHYVVDSNGNLKPASPVIQLHHDRVEYNEDFDKDNPPFFEHLETGVYRITNVREICKDGWTYNKPLNGKSQPYFMIKYEQEDATTLLVRVFERTFDKNTGEFGFGEPRDIGVDERWIDFHFEVDHERIAREEAQMQKEQEEFEEQERLRKEAEEQEQAEATVAWEAEMARHEAEMIAEMEEIESLEEESSDLEKYLEKHNAVLL